MQWVPSSNSRLLYSTACMLAAYCRVLWRLVPDAGHNDLYVSQQVQQLTTKCLPAQDLDSEENAGDTRNIPAQPANQDLQEPCPDRFGPVKHAASRHFENTA